MHGCLHTRSNAARLYLPWKEMGRGLIGIEKRERLNPYMATSEPRQHREDAENGFEGGAC